MRRNAWGIQAVILGVWEGLSLRGLLPPVTTAVRGAQRRFGWRADLAIFAWLFGLAYHFFTVHPK